MSKYSSEKYAMGLDLQSTKHHPGYSDEISAEENYQKGVSYARRKGLSPAKLWAARSLGQLANITHKGVYRAASRMGYADYKKSKRMRA